MIRLIKAYHFILRAVEDEFKYYHVIFAISYIYLLVFATLRLNYTYPETIGENFIQASILPAIFLLLWIIAYYARQYFEKKFSDPIVFMNLLLGILNVFWWTLILWQKTNDTKIFILYYFAWVLSVPITAGISLITLLVFWIRNRSKT